MHRISMLERVKCACNCTDSEALIYEMHFPGHLRIQGKDLSHYVLINLTQPQIDGFF